MAFSIMPRCRAALALARVLVFAFGVLAVASVSFAQAEPVTPPPDLSVCAGAELPDRRPGSTPATPGRWWNPNRYGTGWDFVFATVDGQKVLVLAWYTYDARGRPTWLATEATQFAGGTWSGRLKHMTWKGLANDNDHLILTPADVGSVAIRFHPDDPTRAALSWQWNAAGASVHTECVMDIFRSGSIIPTQQSARVNSTSTGAYSLVTERNADGAITKSESGWGILAQIGQAAQDARYYETHAIAIYDVEGAPVWVQVDPKEHADLPSYGELGSFDVDYFSSIYPGGVPTTDCTAAQPQCRPRETNVGTLARTFRAADRMDIELHVSRPGQPLTDPAIEWHRAAWADMQKITDVDAIVVNRLDCEVPDGALTCPISVNWGARSSTARAFRRNLVTSAEDPIGDASVGEFTDELRAGSRVQYVLRDGVVALSRTPEVRAIGDVQTATINVAKVATGSPSPVDTNGRFTITYRVDVANTSDVAGSYGSLTDAPLFDPNLEVLGARWTRADDATVAGQAAGTGPFDLSSSGVQLPARTTHAYTITIDARFRSTTPASACNGASTGLFNGASLPAGQESGPAGDNQACTGAPASPGPTGTLDASKSYTGTSSADSANVFTATYAIRVANTTPSAITYASLTDTPRFSDALEVLGASWSATGAGAPPTGLADGPGPYQLATSATVSAGDANAHVYSLQIRFRHKSGALPNACTTGASGLRNEVTLAGETGSLSDNSACGAAPPPPALPASISARIIAASSEPLRGPDGAGHYLARYRVTVRNDGGSSGTYGPLQDEALFSPGVRVLGATWTTSGAGAPAGGATDNGSVVTLAPAGTALAPQGQHVFDVDVRFALDDATLLQGCSGQAGRGLFNRIAISPPGADADGPENNAACVALPAAVVVSKRVDGTVAGPDASDRYSVRYAVTVQNHGERATAYGPLRDEPGFAPMLKIVGAESQTSGAGAPPGKVSDTGSFQLAPANTALGAGGVHTFLVTYTFRFDPAEPAPACNGAAGNGLHNAVVLDAPVESTNATPNHACVDAPSPPVAAPPPPPPLAPLVSDQPIESLAHELPLHDPTVGAIEGKSGVSGGAATYEIPIRIPPGRRGMEPAFALTYSSRAGNGAAGLGWSLSGLSSIHRCPATLEQDGIVRPVGYSAADRLCLDGQRLLAVSGSYGAIGTEYRTETESFARVRQRGSALGAATSYFEVEQKNGEVLTYGAGRAGTASSSRVTPAGAPAPLSWLLQHREDRLGNSVEYRYAAHGAGEVLIESVVYTGARAVAGDREIRFAWQPRPVRDRSNAYLAGGLTVQTQRLFSVTTHARGEPVRTYTLDYAASMTTHRSLLKRVTECAHDRGATSCLAPTTVTWQEGQPVYAVVRPQRPEGLPDAVPGEPGNGSYVPAGDLNGDGAREVLWSNHFVTLRPDRTAGWRVPIPADVQLTLLAPSRSGIEYSADFNNDGRTDVVGRGAGGVVTVRMAKSEREPSTFDDLFTAPVSTGVQLESGSDVGAANILFAGDMNADGWSDLVIEHPVPGGPVDCKRIVRAYLNQATSQDYATPSFRADRAYELCLEGHRQGQQNYSLEHVGRVADLDGDGLPDLVVDRVPLSPAGPTSISAVHFGIRDAAGYRFGPQTRWDTESMLPGSRTEETERGSYLLWLDVNGDGLDDVAFPRIAPDAVTRTDVGFWTIRLNLGGRFGRRIETSSRRGLELCQSESGAGCKKVWVPRYAHLIHSADYDGDGRDEILAPRSFAARVCAFQPADPGDRCGQATARRGFGSGIGRMITLAAPSNPTPQAPPIECQERFYCPEDPVTGARLDQSYIGRDTDRDGFLDDANGDGRIDFLDGDGQFPAFGMYGEGKSALDSSVYRFDAVSFVDAVASPASVIVQGTEIVSGPDGGDPNDLYGDGLGDIAARIGCVVGDTETCGIPLAAVTPAGQTPVNYPVAVSPHEIVAGRVGALARGALLNENRGPAGRVQADGRTPLVPEVVEQIRDGLGVDSVWSYSTLAGSANRAADELPLYSLGAARYGDARHFYFASSMPVVSDFARSNGIGGVRSAKYGYEQAIYNHQGRGFQGFRTIHEEDDENHTRATTTFEQIYPLTSRVVASEVRSTRRRGDGALRPEALIRQETVEYACFATGTDADAAVRGSCASASVSRAKPVFVFATRTVATEFDVGAAEEVDAAAPEAIARTTTVAADDPLCGGGGALGYDRYGNATATTTCTEDLGTDPFIARHTSTTTRTFAPFDVANWWLDRLDRETTRTAVVHSPVHQLPPGVVDGSHSVVRVHVFNADRTLASVTTQPGVPNQQSTIAYGYPVAANFGLPDLATVTASGDQNPPRVTRTGYSGDGYFAESTTNPAGHIASQAIRTRDGQPASGVDANGLRTRFEYDPFGRLTLTRHFGTTDGVVRAPDRAIAWTRCGSSCGANAKLLRTEVQDGSPTTATSLDVLGRTVRTTQRLLDGTQSLVDTRYDARGNVVSVSEPNRLGAPAFATRFSEHDALGRPRLKLTPQQADDGAGELETRYRYDGRHTRIDVRGTNVDCTATPSKCLTLSRSSDAFGRYHRTLDAESGRTRFWFDGAGNALAIEDAAGSVVSASYNALAQRTASNDPNRGRWTYTYNALGELLTQTDARGIVTQYRYDSLGRATQRDASGTALDADGDGARGDRVADTWIHDTVAIGQLTSASRRVNGTPVSSEVYSYDAFARPDLVDRTIRTASGADVRFRSETRYDAYYGRAKQLVHPTGDSVRLTYTKYGHLLRESSAANDAEFRRIAAVDGRGQPTAEVLGAGAIRVTMAYAAATGQMTAIAHHGQGNTRLRQIDYVHDVFGNVARQELAGGATEAYEYDRLHRLKRSVRSNVSTGHATVEYGYDAVGNFRFKSDFSTNEDGAYAFGGGACGGGPNAVTSVQLHAASGGGTRRYCYDANGNLVGDSAGFVAVYDHDNLPVSIARGPTTRLAYGADGSRVRQVGADGTRLYAGAYERIDAPALEHKVHLGDYAVITRPGTGSARLEYLLKDRLGSVDAIADTLGRRREARGYDAFGKPREGTWADRLDAKLASTATTPKGFTQHEHLNAVKLIHMNGRAYDYELGRFLSVDPIIQFPTNSQSLNPYSYILNNPLAGTDPSGYLADIFWDIASVVYDVGKIGVGYATGNDDLVEEGGVDLVVDAASTLIPFVPAGSSKVARIAAEGAVLVGDARKAPAGRADDLVPGNGAAKGQSTADRSSKQRPDIGKKTETEKANVSGNKDGGKTHVSYTREHPTTKEVYSGRSRGPSDADPQKIVDKRNGANHHKSKEGYGPAKLDKASANEAAIRGREVQLIEKHGGAKSKGGTSGNAIDGIDSKRTEKRAACIKAATDEFGEC